MSKLKILISGAGLGGLCLAQALYGRGADVRVFERDKSIRDRPQGYRLHIDSHGVGALHYALPPDVYRLFDGTAMKAQQFTTIVDMALEVQRSVPCDEHSGTHSETHVNVSRVTLRQILLAGLSDIVHFGKSAVGYESDDDGVTLHFDDGTSERGDLLIAADGMWSPLRAQRVPQAQVMDAGVRAIYGRLPIDAARTYMPRQAMEDIFTVAISPDKVYLGLGPVIYPERPEVVGARLAEGLLTPEDDYGIFIAGGRKEHFEQSDDELETMSGPKLQKVALTLMKDWPEAARNIPAHGDPDSCFFIKMFSSVPCEMPRSPNVTMLGDAIHGMTPSLGRGANTAMRDAAVLGRHLEDVLAGRKSLPATLAAYEDEMTAYAFDVVRGSAAMGARLMGQNPLP